MATKIYTKTGDQGQTSLFGGAKVSKDDIRVEAYGTVDELNAQIGMLIDSGVSKDLEGFLFALQLELFNLGSHLASTPKMAEMLTALDISLVLKLEESIDDMQSKLPALRNFIIPGGDICVSQCHICRTVCRRAERRIIAIKDDFGAKSDAIKMINRLSDYFFVLGRFIAFEKGLEEKIWVS